MDDRTQRPFSDAEFEYCKCRMLHLLPEKKAKVPRVKVNNSMKSCGNLTQSICTSCFVRLRNFGIVSPGNDPGYGPFWQTF